ncbi:hypothetical protein OIU79_018711 [Salix purpurea]|uniref:Uncharacterized protein n=1 Tax=Salix purpurea TaxID=77065 RepID=A0A9Q0WY26_SALPP|nr:hypothetical protein OIU79_018711 [Salix purpurea]
MKQYGVRKSWTQLCSIRMNGYCMKPLAFTKKGETIIAVDNVEILINDVEDDSFKSLLRLEEQLRFEINGNKCYIADDQCPYGDCDTLAGRVIQLLRADVSACTWNICP